jgi:hypothetical protein
VNNYPMAYALMILQAMQGKQMYQGTVAPVTVQERRTKNRIARKSRRVNRVRAA